MARIWLVLLGLFVSTLAYSQSTGNNPFDIRGKRKASKDTITRLDTLLDDTVSSDTLTFVDSAAQSSIFEPGFTAAVEDNPVDTTFLITEDSVGLVATDTISSLLADTLVERDTILIDTLIKESQTEPGTDEQDQEDTTGLIIDDFNEISKSLADVKISQKNILLAFTILSLLLLATLLTINRSLINKTYRAIANDNYLRFLFREYKSMPWMYWFFYLLFALNLGFFLYMLVAFLNLPVDKNFLLLLGCIILVTILYAGKHMVLQIMSNTFPVEKEANLYSFVTMLVNNLLGLVLIPVNLLVAFAPEPFVGYAIWFGLGAIVLFYLFRMLKGLFISGRYIAQFQFHFFLYLCTAEIAPLLILSKTAMVNFGIH